VFAFYPYYSSDNLHYPASQYDILAFSEEKILLAGAFK